MNLLILSICAAAFGPYMGSSLTCYTCNQGYHTDTLCSKILPAGMAEDCEDKNPTCFESIEWFQNGSLQVVKRSCSGGDYCKNYNNKVGVLKKCKTCKTDLCNSDIFYEPYPTKCQ